MITHRLAWRNIWRNPRRSWVLISTIGVSVFGFLGSMAFFNTFPSQMIDSSIALQGGHIRIAPKGYDESPSVKLRILNPEKAEAALENIEGISYAPEVIIQGMAASPETSSGVAIMGIVPGMESGVSAISGLMTRGGYLPGGYGTNEAVIGEELGEKLDIRLGEKIVLMSSGIDKSINSGAFRVVGFYRSISPDFNRMAVFIPIGAARDLAGYDGGVTAYTIRLGQATELEPVAKALKGALEKEGLEVLTWRDRNPLLVAYAEMFDVSMILFGAIMFVAVSFSMVNSFLMVIYERIKEFGIMMAMGLRPWRIRMMLFFEAAIIAFMGTLLGLALTLGLIAFYAEKGLDLGAFSKGLSKLGIAPVLYPNLRMYEVCVAVVLINVIVGIAVAYPLYKAGKFKIIEAINYV